MEDFTKKLCDNLKILSSTPSEQLLYLTRIGGASVDELALEFEEVMLLAVQKFSEGNIEAALFDSISLLNEKLDSLSGDEHGDYWTEESLFSAEEWQQVRVIAGDCLAKVG